MTKLLDRVDRQIVTLVQSNGRSSNVEIARELGLAEGTVRKRLERLLEVGVIRIAAVVDPAKADFGTHTIIGIEADLVRVQQVAERLAALPEVYSVHLVTGTYDVLIEVVLPSADHLLCFLMDKIAGIPGVKRTETCQVLKVIKHPLDWAIPGEPAAHPDQGKPTDVRASVEVIPGTIIVPF